MANKTPHQIHVALNLFGASPEHLQQALKAAFDQLSEGISESSALLQDKKSGFEFKVTDLSPVDKQSASASASPNADGNL